MQRCELDVLYLVVLVVRHRTADRYLPSSKGILEMSMPFTIPNTAVGVSGRAVGCRAAGAFMWVGS